MSTNSAPEMLMTFQNSEFQKGSCCSGDKLHYRVGSKYSWTYSGNVGGWFYWLYLWIAGIFRAHMHVNFEDDECKHAKIPLYCCGCCGWEGCKCPACLVGMWWELHYIDANTWDRPIWICCRPWAKCDCISYTLTRVIDQDGNRLPSFDDMMKSVMEGHQIGGAPRMFPCCAASCVKPGAQYVNGDEWHGDVCCCCCRTSTHTQSNDTSGSAEAKRALAIHNDVGHQTSARSSFFNWVCCSSSTAQRRHERLSEPWSA